MTDWRLTDCTIQETPNTRCGAIAVRNPQSEIVNRKYRARMRFRALDQIIRSPFKHDPAAGISPFRAEIDDPIGRLDHIQVVLDDHQGISGTDELVECGEQFADIVEMQPGGRFIKNIQRVFGARAGNKGGQLDSLGFASGEGSGGLSEAQVPQPDFLEQRAVCGSAQLAGKKLDRFMDGQIQHLGNVLSPCTAPPGPSF